MIAFNFRATLGVLAVLALGACANTPASAPSASSDYRSTDYGAGAPVYPRSGVVMSIDLVQVTRSERPVGLGMIAGALVGDAFKFTIRMEDRSYLSVTQTTNGDIRVGDRVRIDDGVVHRF